jgi:hypothetical protein
MPKEVRFLQLVEASGKPETLALWTDPKKNLSFVKAMKENRVLTVVQKPTGNKKDFGQVGFHPQPFASYLVFPKRLRAEPDAHVIGLKYQLIEEPPVPAAERAKPRPSRPRPATPEKHFDVAVERVARLKTHVDVDAHSKSEAQKQALAEVEQETFEPGEAKIKNIVKSVKKAA